MGCNVSSPTSGGEQRGNGSPKKRNSGLRGATATAGNFFVVPRAHFLALPAALRPITGVHFMEGDFVRVENVTDPTVRAALLGPSPAVGPTSAPVSQQHQRCSPHKQQRVSRYSRSTPSPHAFRHGSSASSCLQHSLSLSFSPSQDRGSCDPVRAVRASPHGLDPADQGPSLIGTPGSSSHGAMASPPPDCTPARCHRGLVMASEQKVSPSMGGRPPRPGRAPGSHSSSFKNVASHSRTTDEDEPVSDEDVDPEAVLMPPSALPYDAMFEPPAEDNNDVSAAELVLADIDGTAPLGPSMTSSSLPRSAPGSRTLPRDAAPGTRRSPLPSSLSQDYRPQVHGGSE